MQPDVSDEEAIRTIVLEGTCADYADVANVVEQRFHQRVGSARVEEVVRRMKHDMPDLPLKKLKHIDIQFTGDLHRDKQSDSYQQLDAKQQPVASDAAQRDILKFVEAMGGFEAARAAITTVENSLRRLMK